MNIIDVKTRPGKCPKCGGEVYDILYGEPTSTWEEDYLKETGHHAILGGCIISEDCPDFVCKDCGLNFREKPE